MLVNSHGWITRSRQLSPLYESTEMVTSWDYRSPAMCAYSSSARLDSRRRLSSSLQLGSGSKVSSMSNQHCLSSLHLTTLTSIHFVPSRRPVDVPGPMDTQMPESGELTMAYKGQKLCSKFTSVGELRHLTEALTFHARTERGT